MQVHLRWITPHAESTIAEIARVSSPVNQYNPDYVRLIKYLIKNKHWSPFEMANATFEIVTSRAIAQQILRHRSFSFQEFSQRYADVVDIESVELRQQATKNRQSSTDIINPVIETIHHERIWDSYHTVYANKAVENHMKASISLYNKLIAAGVAKESARFVLPLATQTRLYMNGSIRSWIHYLDLRMDIHAQKEHRQVAQQIELILRQQLPTIFAALDTIKREKEINDQLVRMLKDYQITDTQLLEQMLSAPT